MSKASHSSGQVVVRSVHCANAFLAILTATDDIFLYLFRAENKIPRHPVRIEVPPIMRESRITDISVSESSIVSLHENSGVVEYSLFSNSAEEESVEMPNMEFSELLPPLDGSSSSYPTLTDLVTPTIILPPRDVRKRDERDTERGEGERGEREERRKREGRKKVWRVCSGTSHHLIWRDRHIVTWGFNTKGELGLFSHTHITHLRPHALDFLTFFDSLILRLYFHPFVFINTLFLFILSVGCVPKPHIPLPIPPRQLIGRFFSTIVSVDCGQNLTGTSRIADKCVIFISFAF
jgi:hypothetical protein